MEEMFHIQVEDELLGQDWLQRFATTILDAKYEWTVVAEVVDKLTHLNIHQKADLLQVLHENEKMFDGTLGVYPHTHRYRPRCKACACKTISGALCTLEYFQKRSRSPRETWSTNIAATKQMDVSSTFIVPKKMFMSAGLVTCVN
jgi:hypothetical protein